MPNPVAVPYFDQSLEQHAMRQHGLLGRGGGMGNSLYAIDYDSLPYEARKTIDLIVTDGPFPYPARDGTPFGNSFYDLPTGRYLEYTVPHTGRQQPRRQAHRGASSDRAVVLHRLSLRARSSDGRNEGTTCCSTCKRNRHGRRAVAQWVLHHHRHAT